MHKIVATHRIFPETIAMLSAVGEVRSPTAESFTKDELAEHLASARAAMVFMPDRVNAEFLDTAPELTVISAALKGYDNIDVDACTSRGIWVNIVPDLLTAPTAELAIGLLIGLARHIRAADLYVRSGDFCGWTPRFYGLSIEHSTVGIIGMGAVGRTIAKRLSGFDCRILYCDETPACAADISRDAIRRPLEALLSESDFVILCLPLHEGSFHLLDTERLALMRPHALLINPARGSLVNEMAVGEALAQGRLGGYAADTFELEDLSRSDRPRVIPQALLTHPNTLFGAHIGSATTAARRAIEVQAADNIIDALAGCRPRGAINQLRMGYGGARAS